MTFALHGNIGSVSDFEFLSDLNNVQPVDLWPLSRLSLRECAAEVRKMAEIHPTRGLLGYSMGGRIALQALADDPDYWDFAIIVSAHPGLKREEDRIARREKDQNWANLIRSLDWPDFLELWNRQNVLSGPVPPGQIDLEKKRANLADAFENWSLGKQEDLRSKLKNYGGPITWIVGAEDSKFAALGEEMSALLQRCKLIKVPKCGHRVLIENPNLVRELIPES